MSIEEKLQIPMVVGREDHLHVVYPGAERRPYIAVYKNIVGSDGKKKSEREVVSFSGVTNYSFSLKRDVVDEWTDTFGQLPPARVVARVLTPEVLADVEIIDEEIHDLDKRISMLRGERQKILQAAVPSSRKVTRADVPTSKELYEYREKTKSTLILMTGWLGFWCGRSPTMARMEFVYEVLKEVLKEDVLTKDPYSPSVLFAVDRCYLAFEKSSAKWHVTPAGRTFIEEYEVKLAKRRKAAREAARGRSEAMRSIGMKRTRGGWE